MILRLKPSEPAILTQKGIGCYFCGLVLKANVLQKPMSGTSWSHLECFQRHEQDKADRKAGKKASISEAILKMSPKKQAYYNAPQDFSSKGFENEEPNLF